ncbi:hypothetical protein C8T65DRAFT_158010 [Cerioporus squamosus]|nr:hypothetical protein C8T65DRAFT_158010 [Cerioporus squamosus]
MSRQAPGVRFGRRVPRAGLLLSFLATRAFDVDPGGRAWVSGKAVHCKTEAGCSSTCPCTFRTKPTDCFPWRPPRAFRKRVAQTQAAHASLRVDNMATTVSVDPPFQVAAVHTSEQAPAALASCLWQVADGRLSWRQVPGSATDGSAFPMWATQLAPVTTPTPQPGARSGVDKAGPGVVDEFRQRHTRICPSRSGESSREICGDFSLLNEDSDNSRIDHGCKDCGNRPRVSTGLSSA